MATPTQRVLFESLGIALVDCRCRAHVEPLGSEEPNPAHSIAFVRRGIFGRSHEDETLIADPNHVLFFNAGEPYRFSHPVPGGHDCTVLEVESERALDLVARYEPHGGRPGAPFRRGHGLSSQRASRLHWELLGLLERPVSRLTMEDAMAELADEAVASAYLPEPGVSSGTLSTRATRERRELVEAAKVTLSERMGSLPTLSELAAGVGCSPFHLSRTFHAAVGLSLRHYVNRLRAQVAAQRLAAGAQDLTELALDLGFSDHSHFTNAFRRQWGIPPSRFRGRFRGSVGSSSPKRARAAP